LSRPKEAAVRISELSEATGVAVHTLKYYLREGLLMPGRPTSRTRAEYGGEHVERVRLVRALVEHGGVPIAGVRPHGTTCSGWRPAPCPHRRPTTRSTGMPLLWWVTWAGT
jgi:MerR HTH family regulatory protein